MTFMERIGQIWTAAVAYVALALGAGLSITFNVVDTVEIRGASLDRWDIVTAVAFPALVVLMVEMFVSRYWETAGWAMQILRWAGTVAIGGIAMRVSWVHGHDFLINRGQTPDVANLGPIATDLLAIMATALILSSRKANRSARLDIRGAAGKAMDAIGDTVDKVLGTEGGQLHGPDPMDTVWAKAGQVMAEDAEDYLTRLANELDTTTTPAVPVVSGQDKPLPRRGKVQDNQELAKLIQAGADNDLKSTDVDTLLANYYDVSTRTVRRIRAAMNNEPVSGVPATDGQSQDS